MSNFNEWKYIDTGYPSDMRNWLSTMFSAIDKNEMVEIVRDTDFGENFPYKHSAIDAISADKAVIEIGHSGFTFTSTFRVIEYCLHYGFGKYAADEKTAKRLNEKYGVIEKEYVPPSEE